MRYAQESVWRSNKQHSTSSRRCPPLCPCSLAFAPETAAKLGAQSQLGPLPGALQQLAVELSFAATVAINDVLQLANASGIASRMGGIAAAAVAVRLQAPLSPVAPAALLSGPRSVGALCGPSAGSAVVIDGSRSPLSAGRWGRRAGSLRSG